MPQDPHLDRPVVSGTVRRGHLLTAWSLAAERRAVAGSGREVSGRRAPAVQLGRFDRHGPRRTNIDSRRPRWRGGTARLPDDPPRTAPHHPAGHSSVRSRGTPRPTAARSWASDPAKPTGSLSASSTPRVRTLSPRAVNRRSAAQAADRNLHGRPSRQRPRIDVEFGDSLPYPPLTQFPRSLGQGTHAVATC